MNNGQKISASGSIFKVTVGYLYYCVAMTFNNERVWCHNNNVTRATLLFSVSNGNEVTGNFVCLYNRNFVADAIIFAFVTVMK
jgi:hypothetical protein